MTGQDVRKLVVQACLGGDHLLRDRVSFAEGFAREWTRIDAWGGRRDVLQPIHPTGTVARIHLAPCKAIGLSQRQVLDLLLAQPLKCGHRSGLDWAWATILQSARSGDVPFAYEALAAVPLEGEVTHHSAAYGSASYRVLNDLRHRATRETLCHLGLLP